ncbi:MAG TPA: UbiD family decarboxylase [Pirellulales bacterium]|jgi:4-hydroxy-3-polyprenylbenzoate decarboxylase|nr:UbiD family decarboxylase [Pirellulales bacterium]
MGYRTLRHCIHDLARTGQLVRIEEEVDPYLEAAQIHRRVFAGGGPALFFARVRGTRFPMVSNLFGTMERVRYIFRDALDGVRALVQTKIDPAAVLKRPSGLLRAGRAALCTLPRQRNDGPVLAGRTTISELPHLVSWPGDGGAFVTLPLVYTEDPNRPGWNRSNLGMYRVQLSGGHYRANDEVGLHYQIHRGIGVHHAAAIRRGEPLRVNIYVGGAPAMNVAAVMPLPEGMSELSFAGALGRHRIPLVYGKSELPVYAEADFCITGAVDPHRTLPEGPFGDHLGYYCKVHEFPVLRVEQVYHRSDAIWPFTVVGRPPQEDTMFGQLIHELTGPVIPSVIPGVKAVHAVDAAGVHPLLLAIGSERYTPYSENARPQELLTQANAILGQGQLSLAKYLFMAAAEDDPSLDIHDIPRFFAHVLARVDWRRDLHFQTETTIDTLDYSGTALNAGSKVVIAAIGPPRRELARELPPGFSLPVELGWANPRVAMPGVMVLEDRRRSKDQSPRSVSEDLGPWTLDLGRMFDGFPLIVLADDSEFTARTLNNFLWVTFTRSNPAVDIHGFGAFVEHKHWGCQGPLLIDARAKPDHAAPLVEDPAVARRVDRLFASGGPLHGIG